MNNNYLQKFNTSHSHGIMFHHFHSKKHSKSQGSISALEFVKIIKFLGRENILSPEEYLFKLNSNKLNKKEICLTFDDSLKSQYDIALPILDDFNLKAFWFVYTAPLKNHYIFYESFREFINSKFKNFDHFFYYFKLYFENNFKIKLNELIMTDYIKNKKKLHPMYSNNDIIYRYLRDIYFTDVKFRYFGIKLMKSKKFDYKKISKNLFLTKDNISDLSNNNHYIGLHSYSHPMKMSSKNYRFQYREYKKNYDEINSITNIKPISASFPANSYDNNTLKIFNKLKIQIAFRANMNKTKNKNKNNNLVIPRQNHALINKFLKKN